MKSYIVEVGQGAQGLQHGIGGQRKTLNASTFKDETPLNNARCIAFSYSARSFIIRSFSLRSLDISASSCLIKIL